MFGLVVLDETIKEKLLDWLDRDRGGDLSFAEFTNLVNVDNELQQGGRNFGTHQYSATPGSERRPGIKLEELDVIQPEMLEVPMRLIHTLYEKKKVCNFCMQMLHEDAFKEMKVIHPIEGVNSVKDEGATRFNDSHGDSNIPGDNARVEQQEKGDDHANNKMQQHNRKLTTTFTTRHNPWGWDDIRDQILESMLIRRIGVPFETYQEHHDRGLAAKHYLSFNHVPMPSKRGGRPLPIKNKKNSTVTKTMSMENKNYCQKSSMETELANLYNQWKKSGKTIEFYENSEHFKIAEKNFASVHEKHLNISLLKKRKSIMATNEELDGAASKLQAIMRGRRIRAEEAEKREQEIKKKEEEKIYELKLYESHKKEREGATKKLQAIMRGNATRKRVSGSGSGSGSGRSGKKKGEGVEKGKEGVPKVVGVHPNFNDFNFG